MKRFKIWQALFLLVAALVVVTSCEKDDDGIKLDFSFWVPDTWDYYIMGEDGLVFWALSPVESSLDTIQEDFTVYKMAYTSNYADTLYNFYTEQEEELLEEYGDEGFYPVETKDTTINGVNSHRLTHLQTVALVNSAQDTVGYVDAKFTKYYFVRKNYGYVVNFGALESSYDDYKSVFDEIIANFKFTN